MTAARFYATPDAAAPASGVFRYDPSTATRISATPLQPDPWEQGGRGPLAARAAP